MEAGNNHAWLHNNTIAIHDCAVLMHVVSICYHNVRVSMNANRFEGIHNAYHIVRSHSVRDVPLDSQLAQYTVVLGFGWKLCTINMHVRI